MSCNESIFEELPPEEKCDVVKICIGKLLRKNPPIKDLGLQGAKTMYG